MLISLSKAIQKHGMKITGVIHVGAHYGQEHDAYVQSGIQHFLYIEPCERAFSVLHDRFWKEADKVTLIKTACADYKGKTEMYVESANTGMSNSLLRPKKHLQYYPDIAFTATEEVDVMPLDEIPFDREMYNLLVMDCQGAEGLILKGATETLKGIDYVYTEVNTGELYEGCTTMDQLDLLLSDFIRLETKLTNSEWGDAIYARIK